MDRKSSKMPIMEDDALQDFPSSQRLVLGEFPNWRLSSIHILLSDVFRFFWSMIVDQFFYLAYPVSS